MRSSWLALVCSAFVLSLAACASGPAAGPEVRYGTNVPHVRETSRLATSINRAPAVVERSSEPLRLVTDHDRRTHK